MWILFAILILQFFFYLSGTAPFHPATQPWPGNVRPTKRPYNAILKVETVGWSQFWHSCKWCDCFWQFTWRISFWQRSPSKEEEHRHFFDSLSQTPWLRHPSTKHDGALVTGCAAAVLAAVVTGCAAAVLAAPVTGCAAAVLAAIDTGCAAAVLAALVTGCAAVVLAAIDTGWAAALLAAAVTGCAAAVLGFGWSVVGLTCGCKSAPSWVSSLLDWGASSLLGWGNSLPLGVATDDTCSVVRGDIVLTSEGMKETIEPLYYRKW